MILLAVALAWADELEVGADGIPKRPVLEVPLEGECNETPVVIGRPIPTVVDGKATCRGVIVPTSRLADLLNTETAYEDLRFWTRVELSTQGVLLTAAERDGEWWKAQATKPVPITARPWFNYTLGVASVLGAAYGWHLVTTAP